MKKTEQIDSSDDSYPTGEAASILGVSIPTIKRMVEAGELESFRTPGGHTRIFTESIEAVKEQRRSRSRPVNAPSSVLQNRRERLEELTLEAQEHRAHRELDKLKREQQAEESRQQADADARDEEITLRQEELELERLKVNQRQSQEQARREREERLEEQRREAKRELAEFRCRWQDEASRAISEFKYRWLSATQRKQVLEVIEDLIERRQPADEPRMPAIIARSLEALVEPLKTERDAQERRQRVTQRALWSLPSSATEAERVKATAAIRAALEDCDPGADESEMRVAAEEAIKPIKQAVERRALEMKLLNWALNELPWGSDDRDKARLRRECAEILEELAEGTTEIEAKEELEPTVREACRSLDRRQAQEERTERKVDLVGIGIAEVSTYLRELRRDGEISADDYLDLGFATDLRDALKSELEGELTGDETATKVREMVCEIIDGELN